MQHTCPALTLRFPVGAWWAAELHLSGCLTGVHYCPLACHRFEAVWRWALSVELGLTAVQIRQLSAVLLVHQDMTAVEVRHHHAPAAQCVILIIMDAASSTGVAQPQKC